MFHFAGPALAQAGTLLLAFLLTAGLVALTIRICRAQGWVSKPRSDRWHKGTPCFFGGVPIWVSFAGLVLLLFPMSIPAVWRLAGGASLMFALGLADDIWHFRPGTKFLAQLVIAGWIVHSGIVYPLVSSPLVNDFISLFWIVGVTNAFNLLDNMDGLAAGIALISSIYLAIFYIGSGSDDYARLVLILAGTTAGFLVFNFNPAKIFMGDAGSLFLGFLLGAGSIAETTHISGVPALVFAPSIIFAIPVFDTFFVSITRRLRGQSVSQGGTDHSSHRLVQSGLNERRAVLLLYALSIGSGAVALTVRYLFYSHALGLIACWFLFLLLFGIHLFRAETVAAAGENHSSATFSGKVLGRDSLVFFLDPVALSLAYYLAYFLRFGRVVPETDMALFFRSWPIVLGVKFLCLGLFRVYKRSWWRGSTRDLYHLGEAVVTGEVVALLVLLGLYRFAGFSRVVFLLDAVFSWGLLLAIRKSFTVFRNSLGDWQHCDENAGRKVFILGTSEHAEIALRFLRDRHIPCAGLIDTNGGADVGRWVWGSRVLGSLNDLSSLRIKYGVREIILPEDESIPYSEIEFKDFCHCADVRLIRLGLYPAER